MANHQTGGFLAFKNGVFDFEENVFKFVEKNVTEKEGIFSLTTGYDYTAYDPHHPTMVEINTYLHQMFPDEHVRSQMLESLACILARKKGDEKEGEGHRQMFNIWLGNGSNSKSTFMDLVMQAFGDYAFTLPFITLTYGEKDDSINDCIEIERVRDKRLCIVTEPAIGERIDMNKVTKLMEGDYIFDFVLPCNEVPPFWGGNQERESYVRIMPFVSNFRTDIYTQNSARPNEYVQKDLTKKVTSEWPAHFMAFLIHLV